ncbi:MAG: sensor domain-containing diguanylate cyclase [Geobacteraceae bacterium]
MSQSDDIHRQSLEAQVKALEDIIEVAKAVVSTLDLDTVLQAILNSAMGFAETTAGSISLYDAEKLELILHAHAGLTADFVKKERREVKKGRVTHEVLSSGQVLFVEDTDRTPFFKNAVALNEGIKSFICVPLVMKNLTVGILYLDDFVPRQFDRKKMKLLSVLSSFAAMSIYNAQLHKRTKLMAITDSLTGLHNHRYFQQIYTQELTRAKRYKKPLSVVMMDVDDFKKFNDTYGHYSGDLVLKAIGKIIMRTMRRIDYAFRYGGEEFILILPDTRLAGALLVAERLRELIENETAMVLDDIAGSGVTVSLGVACYPDSGASREELFNKVDSLLYKAKDMGKNNVYFAVEESGP